MDKSDVEMENAGKHNHDSGNNAKESGIKELDAKIEDQTNNASEKNTVANNEVVELNTTNGVVTEDKSSENCIDVRNPVENVIEQNPIHLKPPKFYLKIMTKVSLCRVLWGMLYTLFFTATWLSFSSTELCTSLVSKGEAVYAALGLLVYLLLFILVLPFIHVIHRASKDRVKGIEVALGSLIVKAIGQFLMITTYSFSCIWLRLFFKGAVLWTWVGLFGSIFCLFVCYLEPKNYGLSNPFYGLWMGVLVNLEHTLEQCVVVIVIAVSVRISRAMARTDAAEDRKKSRRI